MCSKNFIIVVVLILGLSLQTRHVLLFISDTSSYLLLPSTSIDFLSGDFKPQLKEIFQANLEVKGTIPNEVVGIYVRNGPNSLVKENKDGYHLFDGQGMIHAVKVNDNHQVTYTNAVMKTSRYYIEKEQGRKVYPRIGELKGINAVIQIMINKIMQMVGLVPNLDPIVDGTANTAVLYYNNSLLALMEANLPFGVKIHDNGTLESQDFVMYEWGFTFTAHPKIDFDNKDLVFFGYSLQKPYCMYGVYSDDGELYKREVPIPDPIMMHDFAITEQYSIIMDLPLIFSMENMETVPFYFDTERGSRFGVFPRRFKQNSEIQWFSVPSIFIFHTMNAWEDGDEVVMVASGCHNFSLDFDKRVKEKPSIFEWRFNLKTGKTEEIDVPIKDVEFPIVNPMYMGKKTKFGYFAQTSNVGMGFKGMLKYDVENRKAEGSIVYGDNIIGGECIFVQKDNAIEEDDGYLIGYTHDNNRNQSYFVIYNAKTMDNIPVTKVSLPHRVPNGFHGTFIPQKH